MSEKRIGPYRVLDELGTGGMGTVYAAIVDGRAPGLEQGVKVALKVVHPHLLQTPGFFKRFMREGEVGKSVRHENVVRTYDTDALMQGDQHHHFLVMEFVEGQTLRDLIAELDRVPEELCRHIGREVARALAAIHDAGVVHRDIKPENVLITPDQVIKVMDLGVAHLQDESIRLSQTGAFVGSVQYAAPEQFAGGRVDHRSDLHALGLLLYELACGQQPYYDEDFRVSLKKLLHEEPRRVSAINPQLSPFYEEIVHTLIAKDQDARFQTAEELIGILERGEDSAWWEERAKALRVETKQPLRRIRIPRETALYGRDDELAKLRAIWDRVVSGEGQVLLLEGEAGIGKTRLVDEFIGQIRQQGADLSFLFGTYPPGGAAAAGGAFSTAFREQLGPDGIGDYLGETPLLVPAFNALLRGDATPTGAEPLTRESLVTCFVHATRALAAERPTVLLIDDLQFAPEDARNLFSAVAMAVPGHRVLLVGTVRPGVSQEWHAGLSRLDHVQQMSLTRLGPKDLVHLLKDSFRSDRLAQELGLSIALKSDGNPYFAFEIIRGLREGRYIVQSDDGSWAQTRVIQQIQIPSSVMDLIQARIADLSEEEKDLLEVASCCGYEFDPGLVAAALDMQRIPALKRFGAIEKTHRLVRSSGRRLVFDHYQVQEALYEGLLEQLREEYHSALAEALAKREKAADKDPADLDGALCLQLCEQFLKGARGENALRYLDAAMKHLEYGYLNAQVISLLERVLEQRDLLDDRRRLGLLRSKAAVLGRIGQREAERTSLDEAAALADRVGESEQVIRVALALSQHLASSDLEASRLESARAIELTRATGAKALEADAAHQLASVLWRQGGYDEALRLLDRCLSLARELADGDRERNAQALRASVLQSLGRFDEALAEKAARYAYTREHEGLLSQMIAVGNVGTAHAALGQYDAARAHLERFLEIAHEIGSRRDEAIARHNLGEVMASVGDGSSTRAHLEAALALCSEIGFRHLEAATLPLIASLHERDGTSEAALRAGRAALVLFEEVGARDQYAAAAELTMGAVLLSQGHDEEARSHFEEALQISNETGAPESGVVARCHLALSLDGDATAACAALEQHEARLRPSARMESRLLLWQTTHDTAHLAAARATLDEVLGHVSEDQHAAMIQNVPVHREIWEAAREAGL